jgi:tRNA A37 threonylcarbamoyladenosine dehydratase
MFTEDNADELLTGKPDFVLDAIDNIDTKVRTIQIKDHKSGPPRGRSDVAT